MTDTTPDADTDADHRPLPPSLQDKVQQSLNAAIHDDWEAVNLIIAATLDEFHGMAVNGLIQGWIDVLRNVLDLDADDFNGIEPIFQNDETGALTEDAPDRVMRCWALIKARISGNPDGYYDAFRAALHAYDDHSEAAAQLTIDLLQVVALTLRKHLHPDGDHMTCHKVKSIPVMMITDAGEIVVTPAEARRVAANGDGLELTDAARASLLARAELAEANGADYI